MVTKSLNCETVSSYEDQKAQLGCQGFLVKCTPATNFEKAHAQNSFHTPLVSWFQVDAYRSTGVGAQVTETWSKAKCWRMKANARCVAHT